MYIIKEKKLFEKESLKIFYEVVQIVKDLHERNIVHGDLKLGNMVFNLRTRRVTLINFCLGKHLLNENELLKDQRGSPAYISPDVLSGKPYLGKPIDMWALGVVLYTMLYGQFPFYDQAPQELFRKIKSAEFVIPREIRVSESTQTLIKKLLVLNSKQRLTAQQTLDFLQSSFSLWTSPSSKLSHYLQIVPDIDNIKTLSISSNIFNQSKSFNRNRLDASTNRKISSKMMIDRSIPTVPEMSLDTSTTKSSPSHSFRSSQVLYDLTKSVCPLYYGGMININHNYDANFSRTSLNDQSSDFISRTGIYRDLASLPIRRVREDIRHLTPEEIARLRQLMMMRGELLFPSSSSTMECNSNQMSIRGYGRPQITYFPFVSRKGRRGSRVNRSGPAD